MMLAEYALIGFLAGLAGIILSYVAAWALAHWVFEIHFSAPVGDSAAVIACMAVLAVATGLLLSRGIASHPPLVVLREER
jgi:putative ABC transport system permease protein